LVLAVLVLLLATLTELRVKILLLVQSHHQAVVEVQSLPLLAVLVAQVEALVLVVEHMAVGQELVLKAMTAVLETTAHKVVAAVVLVAQVEVAQDT
jgi:hypothetical protein